MILDGKQAASAYYQTALALASNLKKQGLTPKLAVILANDSPASNIYVQQKLKQCARLGLACDLHQIESNHRTTASLLRLIEQLNADEAVHGILCQLPLPPAVDKLAVFERILPRKDVDCFHPFNVGKLMLGNASLAPCTPQAVLELLKYYKIELANKRLVIIGRSSLVGGPLANMAMRKGYDATVTVCHSRTPNLKKICRDAEILVAAMGQPEFVDDQFVSDKSVVIDVGISKIGSAPNFSTVGDVNFAKVHPKVAAISPVPGGIGPLTIAMLIKNLLTAAAA